MKVLILTQKNWIIFIAFLATIIGAEVIVQFIAHISRFWGFDKTYRVAEFLVTIPVYFSYPFFVAYGLNNKLEAHTKFERLTTHHLVIVAGLFFGAYILRLVAIHPGSAFDFLLWTINVACWLILFSVPAKQLKSIELKRNAGIWEYVPETFQFLFWPLGVWWIQPRLNKMATKEAIIIE